MKRAALLLSVAVAASAAGVATPADASPPSPAKRIRAAVRPLGGKVAVQVTDLSRGRSVLALRAARRRPLGSTTKLFTAAAVLRRFGPGAVLRTHVLAVAPPDAAGVVDGDLVLLGAGDPTLDEAQLTALAGQLAGVRAVTGSVVGDESLFDAARTGPSGNGAFDPELGGALSALAYEHGAQAPGGPPQRDPARAAAARFDDVLEARGVVIRGLPRTGVAPPGAVRLAAVDSPPLSALVAAMLPVSDDWIAELLTKQLAAAHARPATTAVGAALIRARAAQLGVRVSLVDGSGLDPRDRGTAAGLVRLLARMRRVPEFTSALAVAGRTGTLQHRMTSGRARGRCRGKTGTLPSGGVSVLTGYCPGRNGHTYGFAVTVRGSDVAAARRAQDRVAQVLAAAR